MSTRITIRYDHDPTDIELASCYNCLIQFRNRKTLDPVYYSDDILYVNDDTGIKTTVRKTDAGYAVRVFNGEEPTK